MNQHAKNPLKRWDIFCRVIDNFGDVGVCWRLARQLAAEYPVSVRLWIDDITALCQIWPAAQASNHQWLEQVEVMQWNESSTFTESADVVIEAFACELPADYIEAMTQLAYTPRWLNLEYLSAESWVEECHGLNSIHPQNGLCKTFFFPGFSLKTGGLLREKNLCEQRERFMAEPAHRTSFLRDLHINVPPQNLLISLFCYENPALPSLLDTWRTGNQAVTCLVPNGRIVKLLNQYTGQDLCVGASVTLDNLTLIVIPFIPQHLYDHLLWSCDINFVRGEDSFVRAQWAGKPLVWHIYPQDDAAHIQKLNAFLSSYRQGLPDELSEAIQGLWLCWNRGENCASAWNTCIQKRSDWHHHSQNWEKYLLSFGNLAANMVQFCKKTL